MSINTRVVAGILGTAAIAALGFSLDARATTNPTQTATTEDSPGWSCATQGNLICGTPRLRIAVAKLASRPSLVLPGQWQTPQGSILVRECFASYPNTRADKGKPNSELMACLTQPDPRDSDPRVITAHQAHLLHVQHAKRG